MPTYQYSCTDCGHFFEVQQSFTEDSLTVCPSCEGRLRKVFNAVGVVFKGSGFYRTDSRAAQTGSAGGSKADGDSGSRSGDAPAAKDGSGKAAANGSSEKAGPVPGASAGTAGKASSKSGSGAPAA